MHWLTDPDDIRAFGLATQIEREAYQRHSRRQYRPDYGVRREVEVPLPVTWLGWLVIAVLAGVVVFSVLGAEGCAEEETMPSGSTRLKNGRANFRDLWQSIHGPGAWERNDPVWAIEFEVRGEGA